MPASRVQGEGQSEVAVIIANQWDSGGGYRREGTGWPKARGGGQNVPWAGSLFRGGLPERMFAVQNARPRGLKPAFEVELYAALKRRSSTVAPEEKQVPPSAVPFGFAQGPTPVGMTGGEVSDKKDPARERQSKAADGASALHRQEHDGNQRGRFWADIGA